VRAAHFYKYRNFMRNYPTIEMDNMDMAGRDILFLYFSKQTLMHTTEGTENRVMIEIISELDGLRALDPQAITKIHNQYFQEIYRFARYRLGDETHAEDIAGEVFVRLLEATHVGRGPETNLRGWLMGTASNLINDYYRKVYSTQREELSEDLFEQQHHQGVMDDPHDHVEASEKQNQVRLAIQELTQEQKQVLTFRFGNGFTLEETAELMGKKANAIKALQFRALVSLRRNLGDETS
jgi:RNA polymerase sigma-70 factor (ECF subfamily)